MNYEFGCCSDSVFYDLFQHQWKNIDFVKSDAKISKFIDIYKQAVLPIK